MSKPDWPKTIPLAEMLAATDEGDLESGSVPTLLFETGDMLCALDARHVEIIVGRRFIAPLPYASGQLLGIASVQGRMRLVIDLGNKDRPTDARWRLIVLHGDAQLALLADHVFGVRTVLPNEIQRETDDPRITGSIAHGARTAMLLDPERLVGV